MSNINDKKRNLSSDETKELIRQYRETGSDKIACKIIEGNEKLIFHLIHKMFPSYQNTPNMEDLLQEGRMGIFQAILDFDLERGTKFSTHASYKIIHNMYVRTGIDSNSSVHYQSNTRAYKRAIEELANEGNVYPSTTDIADRMGIGIEAVQKLVSVMARAKHMSLDGDDSLLGIAVEPTKYAPDAIVIENERRQLLKEALEQLNSDQKFVISELFLNDKGKPETLSEVAQKLRCKPDDVKRIKNGALRTMKNFLNAQGYGREFYQQKYDEISDSLVIRCNPVTTLVSDMQVALAIEL